MFTKGMATNLLVTICEGLNSEGAVPRGLVEDFMNLRKLGMPAPDLDAVLGKPGMPKATVGKALIICKEVVPPRACASEGWRNNWLKG